MNIHFRKISDESSFGRFVKYLTEDVKTYGGSAGEVVDMHGMLMLVQVCAMPKGTLLFRREMSRLEALAWILQD